MGTDSNAVQRTIVILVAVMCALSYGAFDALIGFAAHKIPLLSSGLEIVSPEKEDL